MFDPESRAVLRQLSADLCELMHGRSAGTVPELVALARRIHAPGPRASALSAVADIAAAGERATDRVAQILGV